MFIRHEDVIVNLSLVIKFYMDNNSYLSERPYRIVFDYVSKNDFTTFYYESAEERDEAFERIFQSLKDGDRFCEV